VRPIDLGPGEALLHEGDPGRCAVILPGVAYFSQAPLLWFAREAAQAAGTLPCVLNAANEEAANAFLRGEIGFLQIPEIVERTMEAHPVQTPTLESILAVDESARRFARTLMLGSPPPNPA